MTETPAPDAAVQIAARARLNPPFGVDPNRAVVAALAREFEFCPPGTLAEIAALRVVADAVQAARADGTLRCPAPVRSALYAALDALPPTNETENT